MIKKTVENIFLKTISIKIHKLFKLKSTINIIDINIEILKEMILCLNYIHLVIVFIHLIF